MAAQVERGGFGHRFSRKPQLTFVTFELGQQAEDHFLDLVDRGDNLVFKIVCQDCGRNGDQQPAHGGDQRGVNPLGQSFGAILAFDQLGRVIKRLGDSPHGTQQPDQGRDGGSQGQP